MFLVVLETQRVQSGQCRLPVCRPQSSSSSSGVEWTNVCHQSNNHIVGFVSSIFVLSFATKQKRTPPVCVFGKLRLATAGFPTVVTEAGPHPHPSLSYLCSLKCGQWWEAFPHCHGGRASLLCGGAGVCCCLLTKALLCSQRCSLLSGDARVSWVWCADQGFSYSVTPLGFSLVCISLMVFSHQEINEGLSISDVSFRAFCPQAYRPPIRHSCMWLMGERLLCSEMSARTHWAQSVNDVMAEMVKASQTRLPPRISA